MTVAELDTAGRSLRPLLRELESHGCILTITEGPSMTGRLSVQVVFPEDEYLEKKCRRILDDWRSGLTPR